MLEMKNMISAKNLLDKIKRIIFPKEKKYIIECRKTTYLK